MLIDWFTVGAQALNFIVLVWLMKRFLYKPVLDAIDSREKRVATELADADEKKASAQRDRDDLQHKNDDFDRERAALLAKAAVEAGVERSKLLDAARDAADVLSAARLRTMVSDAKSLALALRQRTQAEVFALARRVLSDVATTSLEASVCELFVIRLRALDESAKADMAAALRSSKEGALVRTAFELPAAQRTAVESAVNDTFATALKLRFDASPDLVSGIELSSDGRKFSWSIADHLASLERGVDDLLKEAARPGKVPAVPAVPVPRTAPASTPTPEQTPA